MLLYCCCARDITGTTDDTDDRKNGAVLTGRQAVNTLLQKQYVMKNDTPFMEVKPPTGGVTDAACIYSISNLFLLIPLIQLIFCITDT